MASEEAGPETRALQAPESLSESPSPAEEIASASLVVQAILKAARGFALYLPNNPLHGRFFEQLMASVESHLERFGVLRLDLEQSLIRCRGEVIYENSDLSDNLAFRMYADGIRSVQFHLGLEAQELRTFVDLVAMPGRGSEGQEDEDDLVTRLWDADLAHLSYALAEESCPTGPAELGLGKAGGMGVETAAGSIAGSVARVLEDRRAGIVVHAGLTEAPPVLFRLDESEIQQLQAQVAELENRTPMEDVADVVEAILAAEQDSEFFESFVEILVRLGSDLLLTDRMEPCLRLQRMLVELALDDRLPQAHRQCLQRARSEILTEEVLAHLGRAMAHRSPISREDLDEFVRLVGPGGIAPACVLLGESESREVRKVLIDALVVLGAPSPELFFPILSDPRWYLVRNGVIILRRIGNLAADAAIQPLATHKDPRVRREVLHYFDDLDGPGAGAMMLKFLDDPHLPIRINAMRAIGRRHSPMGLDRLLGMVGSPHFNDRDLGEREVAFEVLAELDPERMLPRFAEMFERRYWFRKELEFQETVCAVAGLRRIGTVEAQELVRMALKNRKGRAREILTQALRGDWGKSRG